MPDTHGWPFFPKIKILLIVFVFINISFKNAAVTAHDDQSHALIVPKETAAQLLSSNRRVRRGRADEQGIEIAYHEECSQKYCSFREVYLI